MHDEQDIKRAVRERYAGHATTATSCCSTPSVTASEAADASSCGCAGTPPVPGAIPSEVLGYDESDLAEIPEGADLGLGCGNPLAMLELREGETVVDLGSGGGIDCFLAAKRVGQTGHVIGVDMTPEMIDRARRNAAKSAFDNVEFRLGEIEHLPVADESADAIISNCVINLVPDKAGVFVETFRVLKPGGRLSVSDMVTVGGVPPEIRDSAEAYVACLAGAIERDDYLAMIRDAGFEDVSVTSVHAFSVEDVLAEDQIDDFARKMDIGSAELREAAGRFLSIRVSARKPA